MGTSNGFAIAGALALIAAACGGRAMGTAGETSDTDQGPSALYALDARSCVHSLSVSEAYDQLRPTASSDRVAVVEVLYASACNNMGGHYLIARQVSDPRRGYSMGSNGCFENEWPVGRVAFGVVRYTQTAAWFTLGGSGECLAFPDAGNEPAGTDSRARILAVFPSQDAAEGFAATLR